MDSGKRERIMIACVSFETVRITEPIKYYDCNKVHLIHYVKDENKPDNIYARFYKRVCSLISDYSKSITIIEHMENTTDFTSMLKTVHHIIEDERNNSVNCDIFINTSAGPSEYIAASTIASMMFPGTIPFSASAEEYTIPETEYIDKKTNEPIGITRKVRSPKAIGRFQIKSPDKDLVLGLKILDLINKTTNRPQGPILVESLKQNKLWYRGEFELESKKRVESVYLQRDYIEKWMEEDWVEKDRHIKRYVLTEKGKFVLNTFYTDEIITVVNYQCK